VTPVAGTETTLGFRASGDAGCASGGAEEGTARCYEADLPRAGLFAATGTGACATATDCGSGYFARGPMGLRGTEEYYWFDQAFTQQAAPVATLAAPGTAVATGKRYWQTGLFKWMRPMGGKPSGHSIVTRQWSVGPREAS